MNAPRFTPPPAQPSVRVSKVDAPTERFTKFHDAYRHYRAKGFGKIDALKTAQQYHPELNRAFCEAQERGEAWTREPLDQKNYTAMQLRGKLE
jgi:hypothetical protein